MFLDFWIQLNMALDFSQGKGLAFLYLELLTILDSDFRVEINKSTIFAANVDDDDFIVDDF